ncbi:MAG TPA: AI-2E family transporter [Anaeromyxobacter sp.]
MPATRLLPSSKLADRSLAILAVGAALGFAYLVRALIAPCVVALVLAFTVHPLVAFLERRRVPHLLAALLGTLVATGVIALVFVVLYGRIQDLAGELPAYQDRLREVWAGVTRRVLHLSEQTRQLGPPRQPGTVRLEENVPWTSLLLGTAQGALALAAAATVSVFVLYFALAEGPRLRQKFLAHAGRDLESRTRAVAALEELHRDVSQYMWNRILLNGLLGIVTWACFAPWLDHAVVWGLTTAILHFVPYVGPAIGLAFPVLMALLQYGTLAHALLAGGVYLALVAAQGNVVDPIFLGKQLRLSALVVFVGSLFFFWLWGPVGLFVAVPVLSTLRIVCKYVPRLGAIADFLAE